MRNDEMQQIAKKFFEAAKPQMEAINKAALLLNTQIANTALAKQVESMRVASLLKLPQLNVGKTVVAQHSAAVRIASLFKPLQIDMSKSALATTMPKFPPGYFNELSKVFTPFNESLHNALRGLIESPGFRELGGRFDQVEKSQELAIPISGIFADELADELVQLESVEECDAWIVSNSQEIVDLVVGLSKDVEQWVSIEWMTTIQSLVDCLRCGHFPPAQALAVNICTALLWEHWRIDKSHTIAIDQQTGELPMSAATELCALLAAGRIYEQHDFRDSQNTPATLNRHAVGHGLRADQYTEANSLRACLIAMALLKVVVTQTESVENG